MKLILRIIEERIAKLATKRNKLPCKDPSNRGKINAKLIELRYLRKLFKKQSKFEAICPHCGGRLSVLTVNLPQPSYYRNMPSNVTPFVWPFSENSDKSISNYQVLTIQTRCNTCLKHFNIKYSYTGEIEEVDSLSGVWYDSECSIADFKEKLASSKTSTRRSLLDHIKGFFRKGLK